MLVLFLVSRVVALYKRWGVEYGHDAGPHIYMVETIPWRDPWPRLDACFYCYHPPVGFWAAKALTLGGLATPKAIQLVSFGFTLLAFFCLRASVRWLGALDRPWGIAFLYFTSAMPIQTYLATAQTLDAVVYGWAGLVLAVSLRLMWPTRAAAGASLSSGGAWRWAVLVAALALAMLTKFSGVVLLSIPVLVALLARRRARRHMIAALAACAVAVALVAPYYYFRNYREQGVFFPNNVSWLRPAELAAARSRRDEDRLHFALEMLSPAPQAREHEDYADDKIPRMHDTWRFFWIGSSVLDGGHRSYLISRAYLPWMPWLLLAGALGFYARRRSKLPWIRAGTLFFAIALVQAAALFKFNYDAPYAPWIGVKALYIAPASWAIGWAMTLVTMETLWMSDLVGIRQKRGQTIALVAVIAFAINNAWYLVY